MGGATGGGGGGVPAEEPARGWPEGVAEAGVVEGGVFSSIVGGN